MRVALCLSGMVRTLMQTYPNLQRYLIEPFQPDIFIHTYDKMGLRKENDLPISETWLQGLLNPSKLTIRSLEEWTPKFRRERDRLYCYPGPIWCGGVAPEMRWRFTNILAAAWHVYECDLLRREHEKENAFTYDLVIRARMDNLFLETPRPPIQNSGSPVYVPNHSAYGGTCDQFAIGSSAVMSAYSDYHLHLEKVYRSRVILPLHWGAPENLFRRYLVKFAGLTPVEFSFAFELQRETEIEYQSYRTHEYFLSRVAQGLAP